VDNTATPKHYAAFREKVLSGEIPVCEEISLEMNRIDALIANPKYYYDPKKVDGFISFCEDELTLTDGSDLHLLDTFKLWAEQLLGWYYFVERKVYRPNKYGSGGSYRTARIKKRLVSKQYLIVARGSAKSMYAMCLQAYFLVVDTSTTHQITTAPTMKQAEEVMAPFRTAIVRGRGPVFEFFTKSRIKTPNSSALTRQMLVSTKRGVENFLTGSLLEVRPMAIGKLQGLRPKVSTIDEWLSGDLREDVVGALEQGASKLEDYVIVAISSEGTVRNGSGDTIKMELQKILHEEYEAPHISIWHYKLDDPKEVADPAMWRKANPNLGVTVSYEAYHLDVERSENVPATRNDILAKRFGIPMEGFTYFFTYEETLVHPKRDFWGRRCSLGADLSQGDDFCAFTFLYPTKPDEFGVETRSYITELTLSRLPGAMREKYEEFIREGTLIIFEGVTLDIERVYDDLEEYILAAEIDICSFGYDPYNAREFVDRYITMNGPFGVEKVIQGAKTESVPLGELKHLASQRALLFHQQLMQFTMGNCITMEDTNGNRKLYKRRAEEKIDNVSALMNAYIAWKRNREAFE
jgi:phage terminase large subunit-like protein